MMSSCSWSDPFNFNAIIQDYQKGEIAENATEDNILEESKSLDLSDLIENRFNETQTLVNQSISSSGSIKLSADYGFIDALVASRPNPVDTSSWKVLKLRNIPWDVSLFDVEVYFKPVAKLHIGHISPLYTQTIHIIMDRSTGKTIPEVFIEVPTQKEADEIMIRQSKGLFKGRAVFLQKSDQNELFNALFPLSTIKYDASASSQTELNEPSDFRALVYINREEIQSILSICRNYKLLYSRCVERPYENLISIVTKIPWQHNHAVTVIHRDHIFEMLKLSIECLSEQMKRDYSQVIPPSLLKRLVQCALVVPGFTEKQKMTLLKFSNMKNYPEEYNKFIQVPVEDDGEELADIKKTEEKEASAKNTTASEHLLYQRPVIGSKSRILSSSSDTDDHTPIKASKSFNQYPSPNESPLSNNGDSFFTVNLNSLNANKYLIQENVHLKQLVSEYENKLSRLQQELIQKNYAASFDQVLMNGLKKDIVELRDKVSSLEKLTNTQKKSFKMELGGLKYASAQQSKLSTTNIISSYVPHQQQPVHFRQSEVFYRPPVSTTFTHYHQAPSYSNVSSGRASLERYFDNLNIE